MFRFIAVWMKIPTCTLWKKKSTVNSYYLISNNFHAKRRGKQLWNRAKFKLTRKRKKKLINGHGGMIIQLRTAIIERIQNVQKHALFISLLSMPFVCVFHPWFKCYRRHIVNNEVTRDSVICSLTLRHVTGNRYVTCQCIFSAGTCFIHWAMNNALTNRIAGKLMNIKKTKLYLINGH